MPLLLFAQGDVSGFTGESEGKREAAKNRSFELRGNGNGGDRWILKDNDLLGLERRLSDGFSIMEVCWVKKDAGL
ncbi:hypothetical protein GN956_G22203 [Arapaima gigas]